MKKLLYLGIVLMLASCGLDERWYQEEELEEENVTIGDQDWMSENLNVEVIEELEEKNVTIGDQDWMSENLNVDNFRNGDPISHAKTAEEWREAGVNGQPAWCYYSNDPTNGEKYGKLYNWYAVGDLRGLAPIGWHIPSAAEWTTLTDHLGGEEAAGTKMKSISGWRNFYSNNVSGNGTNESGFSGLPGGLRAYQGYFDYGSGYWWSSTEHNDFIARNRLLVSEEGYLDGGGISKASGLSVRCLRD